MSNVGNGIKTGLKIWSGLSEGKPHSSVTDWVEILTGDQYGEFDLDGVMELCQATDIQTTGPDEAARAIRKKLKYGSTHRQLRALTLLKALSENSKTFPKSFHNPALVDRMKALATEVHTDPKVKRKVQLTALGWKKQYEDGDTAYSIVKDLYGSIGGGGPVRKATAPTTSATPAASATPALRDDGLWEHSWAPNPTAALASQRESESDRARLKAEAEDRKIALALQKEENDRQDRALAERQRLATAAKAKESGERARAEAEAERERLKREKEEAKAKKNAPKPAAGVKRKPFDFAKEKPQVLSTIANASQSANNLINALRLVNREKESVTENARVQKYLADAKAARKLVVRYIQVVTDEEFIGTLLSTNETIIVSLQLYDTMSKPAEHDSDDEAPAGQEKEIADKMAAASLQQERESELAKLQAKQRAAVEREKEERRRREEESRYSRQNTHPDLRDLSFDASNSYLPSPLAPDQVAVHRASVSSSHGTLSDMSDYDSSDEEYRSHYHRSGAGASSSRAQEPSGAYRDIDGPSSYGHRGLLSDEPDPFADPDDDAESFVERPRKEWAAI